MKVWEPITAARKFDKHSFGLPTPAPPEFPLTKELADLIRQAQTYTTARLDLAKQYYEIGNIKLAIAWYEKAARYGPGSVEAARILGDMYRGGGAVPKDSGAAKEWYQFAVRNFKDKYSDSELQKLEGS